MEKVEITGEESVKKTFNFPKPYKRVKIFLFKKARSLANL